MNEHDRESCAYCMTDEKYEIGLFQLMEHWMSIYPPEIADLSIHPDEFKAIYYAMEKIRTHNINYTNNKEVEE